MGITIEKKLYKKIVNTLEKYNELLDNEINSSYNDNQLRNLYAKELKSSEDLFEKLIQLENE